MLRLGLASRLDLDDVTVVGHVAVGDVDDGTTATLTLPRPQLDFRQTREIELLMYFHTFLLQPLRVRVGFCVIFEPILRSLSDLHIGT